MESISRPHHRRKLSNANSFSSKNAYDDVFSGPPKCVGAQTFSPRVKDYTEIFGVSRASSIPILDVPALREPNASADFRSSKIDYSKIFGGFNDDEDTCLSYEELFAKPKGGKRTSKKGRSPSETGPLFPGINNFNSPESNESFVSEVPCQSFDSMKQFNLSFHKTNQQSKDGTSGTTHIAELHAVPGYTCFINEGIPISKKEAIGAKASGISDVHCNMFPSDRKEDTKPSEKTVPQPTKKQTSKAVISDGHCNMFPSDRKEDTKPSEKTLPQPTKKQTSKAFISDGHCDMFPSDKKEDTKPSEKTVPQPTKKQTSKAFISDVHCNTYPSEEKLDVKPSENIVPQLTKRQASEASDQLKRGYSWDGSYVNGDFFRTNEINNRSQPSNVPPSSDARKGLPKRSHSSTFDAPKTDASEAAAGGSSPLCFDEELDVNSAAVMSAAALRKAIEKAQESIRLAKEIMERKTDGLQSSLDQSFKYSLKVKSKRDSKISCKGNEVQEKDSRETHGRVDSLFQVFDVTKRKDALKNGNVSPGTKRTENASTAGMVMGKVQINLSLVKEREGAVWLSELVNPGKHNTENTGYEHVDGKDNLVQLDKHGYKFKQSERAMETHDVLDIHRNVNDACMSEGMEKKVCKLESARFMDIAEENEKSRTAQENDEDWDQGKGLYEDETCLEEDPKAEIFVKKPDFQELNYYIKRPNESQKLEEEDTELAEAFKEAILEKRVERLCEWEEDEDRFTKFNGEEKVRKRNIEVYHWLENEKKLKEVFSGIEGIEKQQKDANERGETKKSLDEASEVEVDDKRLMDNHYWEESEKRTEECHWGKNDGLVRASGYEAIESVQSKANKHKEIEIFRSKDDTENESVGIPHEAIYGMNFDTAAACDSDDNRVSEPHETYGDEMNVETCQNVVECEEGGSMVGITEEFSELEDEEEPVAVEVEPVAVEVACNKMFKGADFVQDVTEEIEVENKTENAYEEPEPVKVTCSEIFKGAGLVHGVTEENEINNKGDNAAEAQSLGDNVRDFCSSDMICEQQQSEQNGKESEPTSSLKNNMHMSNYEVQENGENFKKSEIIFNEEEKISDSETVCDTQWFENAQEIKVSQTLDVSGEKEKEVENYQEINTGDVDISTSQNLEKDQEITTGQHIGSDGEISTGQNMGSDEEIQTCQNVERGQDEKIVQDIQKNEKDLKKSSEMEKKETKGITLKEMEEKQRKVDETNEREREREKDRIAVERAIREARERAFAEARERAERAAVERATAEVRHRVMAEAREKLQKSSTGTKSVTDKSSVEAKLRAERAAVERATAEARERALEKALSQKASSEAMPQADRYVTDNAFRENGLRHSFSSSDLERFDGTNHESAQRRKARLERHQRIMERAAKALAEKNMRDHHAQKEQAERNRLAEILDADIKRWANGKEGNLRALLSTLQYILGSDSGWQSISLTDLIATNAVKKAYRKATLYVHPDKLQQRGASIQQKYICEKVFDLLKAAWNRFNAEQR